jgi:hypothetical protein
LIIRENYSIKYQNANHLFSHQHLAIIYLIYLDNRFLSSEYRLKTICIGVFPCSANRGNGGRGGDTGEVIGEDIGPGGSCFASDHSTIGDECGGSTGSSEPRSGSGDNSMNGVDGGEASVNLSS